LINNGRSTAHAGLIRWTLDRRLDSCSPFLEFFPHSHDTISKRLVRLQKKMSECVELSILLDILQII